MGNDNCYKCSTVDGCLAECDTTERVTVNYDNPGSNWDNCKMRCGAHYSGQAQNAFQKCAIYKRSGEKCWCATGCDNDDTNNANPFSVELHIISICAIHNKYAVQYLGNSNGNI